MEIKKILRNFGRDERQTMLDLAEKYISLGYNIRVDYQDGDVHCDMLAEKKQDRILFEIKSGPVDNRSRDRIEHIRKYAIDHGMKFKLVFARQTQIPQIEVFGLRESLEQEFINNIPSDLDSLSTHTRVIEVEDVYIINLKIEQGGNIQIKGSSEIIVDLIYGSESEDDDTSFTESFPFTFSGVWSLDNKGDLQLNELDELDIDTSSFDQ